MRCEYTLEVVATCPVDNRPDVYRVTIRSARTIPCERILAAVAGLKDAPMYQEDFTHELHRALAAEVETVGYHSGIRAVIVCDCS